MILHSYEFLSLFKRCELAAGCIIVGFKILKHLENSFDIFNNVF